MEAHWWDLHLRLGIPLIFWMTFELLAKGHLRHLMARQRTAILASPLNRDPSRWHRNHVLTMSAHGTNKLGRKAIAVAVGRDERWWWWVYIYIYIYIYLIKHRFTCQQYPFVNVKYLHFVEYTLFSPYCAILGLSKRRKIALLNQNYGIERYVLASG